MDTPSSLLERLRQPDAEAAWCRFVELYTPFIYYWARRAGAGRQDASDLVQEVFVLLLQKLPEFCYAPSGSFRGWLRTVIFNKWRELHRREPPRPVCPAAGLDHLAAPDELAARWDAEYDQHVVQSTLRLLRPDFNQTTWDAFWQHAVLRRPAPEVAAELGLSENAVYLAGTRVMRRLRQELRGLME
jgi:RNA polymerase sigma-70 factor (ECF subfamily)